jgi:hypothetical protein
MIKSSVAGISELPEFDAWGNMLIDGLKLAIVAFIYEIPSILIIVVMVVLAMVFESSFSVAVVGFVIAFLYILIVLPILAMALANMAYHDEFGAAFRFSEIFDKIHSITWGNLIGWYLAMIGVTLAFGLIILVVSFIFALINPIVALVVSYLLITPYVNMFIARSVGLEYISDEPN